MAATDLYTEHAETVEAVLAHIRRANRLTPDAADEFASWARLKLIDNDSAILRKFEGRSSLRTFLVTVIQRLFLDWRIHEWGKWRPTTEARRRGPVAVELERLILRDHLDFEQAMEMLVARGVAHSRDECAIEWAELPQRPARRAATEAALEHLPAPPTGDGLEMDDQRARAGRASAALVTSIPTLSPHDQLIIKLRYQDGFSVARIAQLLGEDQKPLYRRIDQMLGRLRETMVAAGVSAEDVRDLLGNPVVEFSPAFGVSRAGNVKVGPSTPSDAGGGA